MKRLKSDKRPLPITCHHLVLAELLCYLPRVLAEMVEKYRLSLEDDFILTGSDAITVVHRCDIEDSMICPFEQLRVVVVRCDLVTRVSVTIEGCIAEHYEFIRDPDLPDEINDEAILAFVTRRRLPCDMLQDCIDRSKARDYTNMRDLYIHPDRSVWSVQDKSWSQLYPDQVNRK